MWKHTHTQRLGIKFYDKHYYPAHLLSSPAMSVGSEIHFCTTSTHISFIFAFITFMMFAYLQLTTATTINILHLWLSALHSEKSTTSSQPSSPLSQRLCSVETYGGTFRTNFIIDKSKLMSCLKALPQLYSATTVVIHKKYLKCWLNPARDITNRSQQHPPLLAIHLYR